MGPWDLEERNGTPSLAGKTKTDKRQKIETREEQNHQKPKAADNAQLLRIEPLCVQPIIYPDEEALAAPSPHHGRLERENFTLRHATPAPRSCRLPEP